MQDLPTGTVTFLFTDVEGSTSLLKEIGVERYAEVRAEHHRLLREACSAHGGVEVDSAGDGLFVAFRTASDATAAAVDAQTALTGIVAVRMGLHSGEPLLTPDGYAGIDVTRAARIAAVAHGGQVLLSQTAYDLVGDDPPAGVSFRDLGDHRLKDLSRPQRLFQLAVDGLSQDFPPLRSLANRSTNLPSQATPLIGRVREVNAVAEVLRHPDRRLVTLIGPGGSGKTRLALQVAAEALDDFPDGIFLVRLEGLDDPTLVVSAIAQVLQIRSREGVSPEQLVGEFVRDRHLLLVLDNFEQVLDAAPLIGRLLAESPDLRFLVTSIAPLRIAHETQFPVPPLAVPKVTIRRATELAGSEAVTLFVERARAARQSFKLTDENAGAVASICVGVDGLPLALELAAARTRILSPEALVERLDRRLALLAGGARDAPDRQRTLRATIDWSYRLVDGSQQGLFQRLSVFAGGCALEAVEAVCRPEEELRLDVLDGLTHLVENSMLKAEEPVDGRPRFTMLETLREYAGEKLGASGDADELHRRHAEHFLGDPSVAEIFLDTRKDDDRQVIADIERELENVRAALDWAHETGSPLELGLAMCYQRSARVFPGEARQKLHRALESDKGPPSRLRARALAAVGGLARMQGDPEDARVCFEESARIYREIDDVFGLSEVLARLARTASDRDDLEDAVRFARDAEAVARSSGDVFHLGVSLAQLGLFALAQGELGEARSFLDGSVTVLDEEDVALPELFLVYLAVVEGQGTAAVSQAAGFVNRLDPGERDKRYGWMQIETLAAALAAVGEIDVAVRLHVASERWHEDRGATTSRDAPPRLRARLFGELEQAMLTPEFETAANEGRDLDLDEAVALGLAAARRIAEGA